MRRFAVVIALSLAFASDTAAIQSQVRSREAIIGGIRNGEISAVVEAEQSGDRTLVPFILAELREPVAPGLLTKDTPFIIAARHAIGALADRRQLQEVWCATVKEDDLSPPVGRLGVVGGWFGIRGLQELLKPERQKNFDRALRRWASRSRYSDISFLGPDTLAVLTLPNTVSNPPVALKDTFTADMETINKWNDWIAAHRDELQKLAPTGEGVDYSERACKGGKPVKR